LPFSFKVSLYFILFFTIMILNMKPQFSQSIYAAGLRPVVSDYKVFYSGGDAGKNHSRVPASEHLRNRVQVLQNWLCFVTAQLNPLNRQVRACRQARGSGIVRFAFFSTAAGSSL